MVTDYIEQKPGVLGGKAVIKGTRIGVDLILEKTGACESIEDLLKASFFKQRSYPCLHFLRCIIGEK
jgi:uncharacterized protein (DUF433 family)